MTAAGVIHVLVAMTAALTVPIGTLSESDAALLEAVVAVTNTTLCAGLLAVALVLLLVEFGFGKRDQAPGTSGGTTPSEG